MTLRKCYGGRTVFFWLARGSVDARGELWACLCPVTDKTHVAPCGDLAETWVPLHVCGVVSSIQGHCSDSKQARSQLIHSCTELKPWFKRKCLLKIKMMEDGRSFFGIPIRGSVSDAPVVVGVRTVYASEIVRNLFYRFSLSNAMCLTCIFFPECQHSSGYNVSVCCLVTMQPVRFDFAPNKPRTSVMCIMCKFKGHDFNWIKKSNVI